MISRWRIRDQAEVTGYFQIATFQEIMAYDLSLASEAALQQLVAPYLAEWVSLVSDRLIPTLQPVTLTSLGHFYYDLSLMQSKLVALFDEIILRDPLPSIVIFGERQGDLHIFDGYENMMYHCSNERTSHDQNDGDRHGRYFFRR